MADDAGREPASPGGERAETRPRQPSIASKISGMVRSLSKDFDDSNPPAGFIAATSQFSSSVVVGVASRKNSGNSLTTSPRTRMLALSDQATEPAPRQSAEYKVHSEENTEGKQARRNTDPLVASGPAQKDALQPALDDVTSTVTIEKEPHPVAATEPFDNGYHFPPRYPKSEAFKHGLVSFMRYCITPMGFCVVLYGLNVVAWGGMLFLLLCNASPAMCHPTCNYIDSARRVWIEYDSQVLTALFSLTAFGLAPWRFRDLYYLMKYRLMGRQDALRRLAGYHRDWFRLPGSSNVPVEAGPANVDTLIARGEIPEAVVAAPTKKMPDPPLTGVRAPPTKIWKMDFMIWTMVWNTLFQCVLSGVMWGMNRHTRPSWSTGLFVALGCIVAAIGGLTMFFEGKKVKSIEGVPLSDRDRARLVRDQELGIQHYNNIEDKPPNENNREKKKGKRERRREESGS